MCDVEQRLNTENINLATQSSKESISALHCAHFDQLFQFLRGFCLPARCEARREAGKSAFAANLPLFMMQCIDKIEKVVEWPYFIQNVLESARVNFQIVVMPGKSAEIKRRNSVILSPL